MTTRTVTLEIPDWEYAALEDRAARGASIEALILDAVRRVYGIPLDDEDISDETIAALRVARTERERGEATPWEQVKREDGIDA